MSKRKTYIPTPALNPIIQARKVEKLDRELKRLQAVLDTVINTYERHMAELSNFASHNMGNAIQSMYASIVTYGEDTELAKALKGSVDNLNGIVDSFKQVVSCTHEKEFCLNELRIALQTLIRASCLLNNIELIWKYDTDDNCFVKLPFQSLLQVLHNLVSNAIKALQSKKNNKIIEIETYVNNNLCIFKVKNNGIPIPKEDVTKIYEYRFTTTEKGSGIGLYFSKYIVQDKLGGSITLEQDKEGYTTIFSIKIPLYHEEDNINN